MSLVRIPEWLSFEEASTLPCAGVTVHLTKSTLNLGMERIILPQTPSTRPNGRRPRNRRRLRLRAANSPRSRRNRNRNLLFRRKTPNRAFFGRRPSH